MATMWSYLLDLRISYLSSKGGLFCFSSGRSTVAGMLSASGVARFQNGLIHLVLVSFFSPT